MKYLKTHRRLRHTIFGALALTIFTSGCDKNVVTPVIDPGEVFTMPAEEETHEGTWLQWPHNRGWDNQHVQRYEASWVEMTRALHTGERVHLVVYDAVEKDRVHDLLTAEGLNMGQVDFFTWPTDDVWVRDNGPVFVRDASGKLALTDWQFNGWGQKADYQNDNEIPRRVSEATGIQRIAVEMVNEGGSIEVDGRGTLMAKRSSILNNNRNRGWSQADAESYFKKYLGVTNFIWLDGVKGADITDDHIDGTARFANGNTIVTHAPADSEPGEYEILASATNANGEAYSIVHLPKTQGNIPGTNYRGFYINFYVGNEVVLMPSYDDPNDAVAQGVLESLYPTRRVVHIKSDELAKDGGMVHCVTQQQPL